MSKKGVNEFEYYANFSSSLNFNLLNMDIEMYAWNEKYKLYSGKEITEKYVVMIFDKMMIWGKLYAEDKSKLGMEIIRYQISE